MAPVLQFLGRFQFLDSALCSGANPKHLYPQYPFTFIHLDDAFIQSDGRQDTTEGAWKKPPVLKSDNGSRLNVLCSTRITPELLAPFERGSREIKLSAMKKCFRKAVLSLQKFSLP